MAQKTRVWYPLNILRKYSLFYISGIMLIIAQFIVGCGTLPKECPMPDTYDLTKEKSAQPVQKPKKIKPQPSTPPEKSVLLNEWPLDRQVIQTALINMLDDWGEPAFEVDIELVRHVSYFFKYYSVIDYQRSNRAIERSQQVLSYIRDTFETYRLPEEIAFALPFVESSFNPHAKSGVGAVGMFQFMKETARNYGLKVTRNLDERLDVYKAAPACAKYLRNNRNVFASIVLSLGSYHHGTGKVSQVLLTAANADERNFGSIFNNKRLGRYSKEYIPQCLAAALIYRLMKERQITSLPKADYKIQTIKQPQSVQSLEKQVADLYPMNPDLIQATNSYPYASTNGYILISQMSIGKLDIAKAPLITQRNTQKKTPVKQLRPDVYQLPDKPTLSPSGSTRVTGRAKYIRYVFQQGNTLQLIAQIFGTTKARILNSKENRYLLKRAPKPGDVIRIDGLSPTTQKMGGGGYVCGKQMTLRTKSGDTLTTLCSKVKKMIRQSCASTQWEMGADITPSLIYYWNQDELNDVSPLTLLKSGTDLVIYTDYLWLKQKKLSKPIASAPAKPSTQKLAEHRRTGKKYLTYFIQEDNKKDNFIETISTIFHVSTQEVIAWNPWLSNLQTPPFSWKGKPKKLIIKQCPNTTQKFGNPGIVCGKGQDTRFTMHKGQTLNDVVVNAIKQIQACGGKGYGITENNILYWNADILKHAGVTQHEQPAKKTVKLTIYVDFF